MSTYEEAIEAWKRHVGPEAWIGVDLDSTLAYYDHWHGPHHIGEPIEKMAVRVWTLLANGLQVKIFTARASDPDPTVIKTIQDWTEKHFGVRLDVTPSKDYNMIEAFDDRIIQVIPNTGMRVDGKE